MIRGFPNNTPEEDIDASVLVLARAKLSGAGHQPGIAAYPVLGQLASLDLRLCFDYEPRRQAVEGRDAKLVASHMRLAYSVPRHREYFHSGYSSEPLLAEVST